VLFSAEMKLQIAARGCLLILAGLHAHSMASANDHHSITQKNVPIKMRGGVLLRAAFFAKSSNGRLRNCLVQNPDRPHSHLSRRETMVADQSSDRAPATPAGTFNAEAVLSPKRAAGGKPALGEHKRSQISRGGRRG
jgi:hypothetical protein